MKVRLMGLEEECSAAIDALQEVLVVVEVNGPYENRDGSKLVRYYVETRGARLCPPSRSRLSHSFTTVTIRPGRLSTRCILSPPWSTRGITSADLRTAEGRALAPSRPRTAPPAERRALPGHRKRR